MFSSTLLSSPSQAESPASMVPAVKRVLAAMNEMLNNAGMQLPGWIGETFDNQEEKVLPNQDTVVEEVKAEEVKKENTES